MKTKDEKLKEVIVKIFEANFDSRHASTYFDNAVGLILLLIKKQVEEETAMLRKDNQEKANYARKLKTDKDKKVDTQLAKALTAEILAIIKRLDITGTEDKKELCPHCLGRLAERNPTEYCDHLYYPKNCRTCEKMKV